MKDLKIGIYLNLMFLSSSIFGQGGNFALHRVNIEHTLLKFNEKEIKATRLSDSVAVLGYFKNFISLSELNSMDSIFYAAPNKNVISTLIFNELAGIDTIEIYSNCSLNIDEHLLNEISLKTLNINVVRGGFEFEKNQLFLFYSDLLDAAGVNHLDSLTKLICVFPDDRHSNAYLILCYEKKSHSEYRILCKWVTIDTPLNPKVRNCGYKLLSIDKTISRLNKKLKSLETMNTEYNQYSVPIFPNLVLTRNNHYFYSTDTRKNRVKDVGDIQIEVATELKKLYYDHLYLNN
jgi:hypothetical protein